MKLCSVNEENNSMKDERKNRFDHVEVKGVLRHQNKGDKDNILVLLLLFDLSNWGGEAAHVPW